MSNTKNGAPRKAVTTPTGRAEGLIIMRATVSAAMRKLAPNRAEAGRSRRWSCPRVMRTRWGTMSP